MGATLSVISGYGFPEISAANPSLIRLAMGAVFPLGLILIILAGGELFTGNCAVLIPNVLSGRQSVGSMLRNWTFVWLSNFVGALFFGYLFVYLTGISSHETTLHGLHTIAAAKTSSPFFVALLKGVGANWLVCLAVWLAMASDRVSGKIIAIWFPIMAFITIGYEHSIANMFLLPMAMWEGYDISFGEIMSSNIIPVTIGNIIGGALFVGGLYWYLYDKKSRELE